MGIRLLGAIGVCSLTLVAACSPGLVDRTASDKGAKSMTLVSSKMADGEIAVPAGYRQWPKYLIGIDKAAAKQIRDIYISPKGHQTSKGESFPDGTVSVMEIWTAKTAADGVLMRSADGKLVKDGLSKVFVMAKSPGAGELVNATLRTGDWVYAGYEADGVTPGGPPTAACRSCHLKQPDTDWVFRYDEYFAKRGS